MAIYSIDVLLSCFLTHLLLHAGSNCCFLTCIQVSQVTGNVVWSSQSLLRSLLSKALVSEAEVDVFLELPCFFCDLTGISNLLSGSSAFSNSRLYLWNFSVQLLLKPSLKNFEHYFSSMWNELSCAIIGTFFCPYGNLVKEVASLKSAKAASNPQRDKIWWRVLQDTVS